MSAILIVVVAIIVIALYIQYLNGKENADKMLKFFKTPPRTPFLGITMMVKSRSKIDPIEIFNSIMSFPKKYGPNVALFGILNHVELLITRPEDVELIMTGKNTKKSHLYSFIQPWLGEGLLISHGTKWFNRRKIITPTFHFKILEQFIDVFNEQDKKLVSKLAKYAETNEDCNIYEHITAIALDNICETAMGVKINAQDNPNSEYILAVKEMSELIFNRIFSLLNQYPRFWAFTPQAWKSRRVIRKLHKFTDTVINDRREQLILNQKRNINHNEDEIEGKKPRFSFLDMLLQVKTDGEPLSHLDVREEVDTFMFEGHDTTTSGMSFAMFHLAMNPEEQEKAFEEQRKIMGEDPSTPCSYNDLQEMKYLEKVIKEVLRINPSVALIGRETLEPIQIQGVTIPVGFNLSIPIYAIHRNEKVFPDPERFDPERFDEEKERTFGPFQYLPFSAGTRNCIGQRFAMLEMKAVISTIIRNYKIIATEKTKNMKFRSDLILRPIGGLYVGLQRRVYK